MGRLDHELAKLERRLIKEALAASKKDAARAAKLLGVTADDLAERARRLAIPLLLVRRRKPRESREPRRRRAGALLEAVHNLERRWMREALADTGGDISAAAALINMERSQFYRRIEQFGLQVVRSTRKTPRDPKPRHRDLRAAVAQLRDKKIRAALRETDGDKAAAAKLLGVARSTIYRFCLR